MVNEDEAAIAVWTALRPCEHCRGEMPGLIRDAVKIVLWSFTDARAAAGTYQVAHDTAKALCEPYRKDGQIPDIQWFVELFTNGCLVGVDGGGLDDRFGFTVLGSDEPARL